MATRQRKAHAAFKKSQVNLPIEVEKPFKNTLIHSWNDLPLWLQDNHFILTGYRSPTNSYVESFSSLRYLHNESVNVYSHLLGALAFTLAALISFYTLGPRYQTASRSDVVAFGTFFLGAIVCLGISATFHAVSNHSVEVLSFMNKLDCVGIVLLITGSFIPSIYYGFYCEPTLQLLYWTMVSSIVFLCLVQVNIRYYRFLLLVRGALSSLSYQNSVRLRGGRIVLLCLSCLGFRRSSLFSTDLSCTVCIECEVR